MLKSLAIAAAALFATTASATTVVVPLGEIVVPPTQTFSTGVFFIQTGIDTAYFEFSISQPNTTTASSFTNSAVGTTGVFNFTSIALYSGLGAAGSLLETGVVTPRLGGSEFAYLDGTTLGVGTYTIAYTGEMSGGPASVGSSITFAAGAGAVPEMSTWSLMIAGFGMIGFAARRRRSERKLLAA